MSQVNRRDVLRGLVALPMVGAGLLAIGCKKQLSCTDVSGLSEPELKARNETFAYVDKSPNPEQRCSNCTFFQPAGEGQCGGCKLVKGPIHPEGWCKSWSNAT